ncbi:MAG: c-type cytochrome [Burkholderiaceae bacterium]|jgi:cytochrome c553
MQRPLHALLHACLLLSLTLAVAGSAFSKTKAVDERMPMCLACHGATGQSTTASTPSLGGQPAGYVLIQLFMFRENLRHSEIMNPMAKDLSDDDLRAFSESLAKLPAPLPGAAQTDAEQVHRVQQLVQKNHCNSCHNPDFSGHENIPRLAGQRADYLAKTLKEYKTNVRAGYDGTMSEVMQTVGDSEIADLADYLSHWHP